MKTSQRKINDYFSKTISSLNNVQLGLSVVMPLALHVYPGSNLLLKSMSTLNVVNALSSATVLSLGIYDKTQKKTDVGKYAVDSMIAFGSLGLLSFGLSMVPSIEKPFLKYHQLYRENTELVTKDFERLPLEKKKYNIHYIRQRFAEETFGLQKERQIFLESKQEKASLTKFMSSITRIVKNDIDFRQTIENELVKKDFLSQSTYRTRRVPLLQDIADLLGLPEPEIDQQQRNAIEDIAASFNDSMRTIQGEISLQNRSIRYNFSSALAKKHALNIINSGFAFAGGISYLYRDLQFRNKFHKQHETFASIL